MIKCKEDNSLISDLLSNLASIKVVEALGHLYFKRGDLVILKVMSLPLQGLSCTENKMGGYTYEWIKFLCLKIIIIKIIFLEKIFYDFYLKINIMINIFQLKKRKKGKEHGEKH